jgi:hypothetical protein
MTNSVLRLLASSQIASVLTDGGGLSVLRVPVMMSPASAFIIAKTALAEMSTGAGIR